MPSRTHNRTNRIHDSIRKLIPNRLLTRIGLALSPKSSIEVTSTTTLDNDQSEQPSPSRSVTANHVGGSSVVTII
ncbi:hypothetical protein Hanom_Chr03g00258201 [Helianthus anomalus]